MQDYLPLSSQQLETIHRSTKGILPRIPRGLEKLKCVRITHEANSEELHVWATDRYCVLHLVIHCSAAAPAVDTCVDHSALAAALAELKASPLTRVKLSESEFTIDSVTTAPAFSSTPSPTRRLPFPWWSGADPTPPFCSATAADGRWRAIWSSPRLPLPTSPPTR